MSKAIAGHDVAAQDVAEVSELHHLLALDKTPWYRKKNLRRLYLCLVPAALGVEMTSGYDGSVLNGLQAVQPWQDCKKRAIPNVQSSLQMISIHIVIPIPYIIIQVCLG